MLEQRDILRNVRHIEIRTDRLSQDLFAGGYHSVFKGLGLEFDEVREYAPGDDIRSIDWNVTARMGAPHVKSFVEERELTVILVVDASASLDFGTQDRSKEEAAAEVCALLAFSAIKNNDKVGLVVFTDDVELYLPPRKGRRQVLRVIREVLYFHRNKRGTDLRGALEFVARTVSRRAVVFVVSDFQAPDYLQALTILERKHDVIAVDLYDPRERELSSVGLIEIEDAETGRRLLVDTSMPGASRKMAGETTSRVDKRHERFRSRGVDVIPVTTASSPVDPLVEFFERRRRRLRR